MERGGSSQGNLQERITNLQKQDATASSISRSDRKYDEIDANNNVVKERKRSGLSFSLSERNSVLVEEGESDVVRKPSYIPSYVRNVSFNQPGKSPANRSKTKLTRSLTCEKVQPKRRANSECLSTYRPSRDLARLREKYRRFTTTEVCVKQAIAAMECKLSANGPVANSTRLVRPLISSKPALLPKPTMRSQNDPIEILTRKALHRRSMSDPNLQKTFSQMKQLWDQKIESEKQAASSDCSRSGSMSSVNSIGSSRSVGRTGSFNSRGENRRNTTKHEAAAPHTPSVTNPATLKKTPLVPPKPKGHKPIRERPDTPDSLDSVDGDITSSLTSAKMNDVDITSRKSENLSVSERAMLFGGTKGQPSLEEVSRRRSTDHSAVFHGRRRSWSDESTKEKFGNERRSTQSSSTSSEFDDVPYTRQRNDSEVRTTPRTWNKKKNARKEYQSFDEPHKITLIEKVVRSTPSTDSSLATSDDEDREVKKNSFLAAQMRFKGPIPFSPSVESSSYRSSTTGQKTEEPPDRPFSAVQLENRDTEESQVVARRRASSLHRLIKKQRSNQSPQSTPPGGSPVLKRLLQESTNTINSEGMPKSMNALRPTDLALFQRERANTDQQSKSRHKGDVDSKKERSSSLSMMHTHGASPSSPGKRSSGFSEESPLPSSEILIVTSSSPPPQSAPESGISSFDFASEETSEKTRLGETMSSSSAESFGSQDTSASCVGEFNPSEEYDKIAKQINEDNEGTISKSKFRPISDSLSIGSVDSGFRNSIEVPSRREINEQWTDSDVSDEEERIPATPGPDRSEVLAPTSPTPSRETTEVKLHNIAKELLSTEESYVKVLHLIDQVFHKQLMDAALQNHITTPKQVVENVFSHISSIYQFHKQYLLPQLQNRLKKWETNPAIGDIMTEAAPFLKMYSLYVQNFDEAMNMIRTWSEKSSGFSSIIKTIQKTPECHCLTLEHHMLSPVQRVPRYRLLLADYVKRLPEDAGDRENAVKALELITVAATHANETMKKMERFQKLVNVQNSLTDVNFDIVDASRELLKEGKIIKISARNGEKYERYIYLLSDMLLCCTPIRRLQSKSYKVTARIDVGGMEVIEVKNPTVPFAFCVNGLQKSMEFATNTAEEKAKWVQAIRDAIEERLDRLRTFRTVNQTSSDDASSPSPLLPPDGSPLHRVSPNHFKQPTIDIDVAELGKRAPRWIKDQEVTMCMSCSKAFNKFLRRRHHCRACGKVICSDCSEHKAILQYDPGKPQKVCVECYRILTGRTQTDSTDAEKKGVLEVEADTVSEKSVIADYLYFTENEKKRTWAKTWCVIPNDELCLYFYRAHQDVRAQMTMPLPGFKVYDMESNDHKYCFKFTQAKKVFLFASNDYDCIERWKYALGLGSRGEDLCRDDVYRLGKPLEEEERTEEKGNQRQDGQSSETEDTRKDGTLTITKTPEKDRYTTYSSEDDSSTEESDDSAAT